MTKPKNIRPIEGYVDATDLDCEFETGVTFAKDLEGLYYGYNDKERTCLKECGVYRVEIKILEKISGEKVAELLKDIPTS